MRRNDVAVSSVIRFAVVVPPDARTGIAVSPEHCATAIPAIPRTPLALAVR